MERKIEECRMMQWLRRRDQRLHSKLLELRDEVNRWLTYVPATFPHYTSHTVDHSEEIIRQVSWILFGDAAAPRLRSLSPTEAYIVAASAYLHDAGMVCSDMEKRQILESEEWGQWVSSDTRAQKTLTDVERMRTAGGTLDRDVAMFLADRHIRFLLAEFVRARHPKRAATLIEMHEGQLGRFAFGDPLLRRTIADVCLAHGLPHHAIEDASRFPQEREVLGHPVNVQFVAVLLRLGDLLDLRSDRACPLLLSASCPLPASSSAHWSQYRAIVDRLTSPAEIRIRAECERQEEHRTLRDWLGWLEDEAKHATVLMSRATRHSGWAPPRAVLSPNEGGPRRDGRSPTLFVGPSKAATYVPRDWTFELDPEAVFERLVRDAYTNSDDFVRELLQNAIDATRCQLTAELRASGLNSPLYTNEAPLNSRMKFPIVLALRQESYTDELTGETHQAQVLDVKDAGLGMDEEVIRKYLLQVGRSFYRSDSFRREFGFVPTSQFGVGFLSVFGASEYVEVCTWRPESASGALKLTLTGPRSYLLIERGSRTTRGTTVSVRLQAPLTPHDLLVLVRSLCRRVEFPIRVEWPAGSDTILADEPLTFSQEDPSEPDVRWEVRALPFKSDGCSGESYVMVRHEGGQEWWNSTNQYREAQRVKNPGRVIPELPAGYACFHGILVGEGGHVVSDMGGGVAVRVDIRKQGTKVDMSRGRLGRDPAWSAPSSARVREALAMHLQAVGEERPWQYYLELSTLYRSHADWTQCRVPVEAPHEQMIRLADLGRAESVALTLHKFVTHQWTKVNAPNVRQTVPALPIEYLGWEVVRESVGIKRVPALEILSNGAYALVLSIHGDSENLVWGYRGLAHQVWSSSVASSWPVFYCDQRSFTNCSWTLLNTATPLGEWLAHIMRWVIAERRDEGRVSLQRILEAYRWFNNDLEHVPALVGAWRGFPGLPEELLPPKLD